MKTDYILWRYSPKKKRRILFTFNEKGGNVFEGLDKFKGTNN
jgi:hypothetical protein